MPVLLALSGRPAVVVGGTDEATAAAESLLAHGATVTVVACAASLRLHALAASGSIGLLSRDYVRGDLAGAFVVACFDSGEIAAAVSDEANAERCLAYVAGRADLSTVQLPSDQSLPASAEERP